MLVTPVLGTQRQADPWVLLEISPITELQLKVRGSVSKNEVDSTWG